MKRVATLSVFLLVTFFASRSTLAQGTVELWFFDPCDDEVYRVGYTLSRFISPSEIAELSDKKDDNTVILGNMEDRFSDDNFKVQNVSPGEYFVTLLVERGPDQWLVQDNFTIQVDNEGYSDTLKLSRILKVAIAKDSNTLYMNCDKLCNGEEEDRYDDGTLRLEGTFENGVGREINFYNKDGLLVDKISYTPNDTSFSSWAMYRDGQLVEYIIHKRLNKRKVMEYTYNADSVLVMTSKIKWPKKGW